MLNIYQYINFGDENRRRKNRIWQKATAYSEKGYENNERLKLKS